MTFSISTPHIDVYKRILEIQHVSIYNAGLVCLLVRESAPYFSWAAVVTVRGKGPVMSWVHQAQCQLSRRQNASK